jgi:hypothetical protein
MPTSVRVFWWICALWVVYGVAMTVWALLYPGADYFSYLAKLPSSLRDQANQERVYWVVKNTLLWAVPILTFASLAAFKRLNWARWAFAGVLAVNLAVDLLMANLLLQQLIGAALVHDVRLLDVYFQNIALQNWQSPWLYLNSSVLLSATGLAFSPQSRVWFSKTMGKL